MRNAEKRAKDSGLHDEGIKRVAAKIKLREKAVRSEDPFFMWLRQTNKLRNFISGPRSLGP